MVSCDHGMHNQCGSVGGAALHPGEELWLCEGDDGAGGSGGGRGNSECEGIAALESNHCSGQNKTSFLLHIKLFSALFCSFLF